MKNKWIASIAVSLLIGGGVGWGVSSFVSGSSETVATVNGEHVTKEELYNALATQYGSQTIDFLITNTLIDQETKKEKITASDKEIEHEVEAIQNQYGDKKQFEEALKSSGTSLEELKKDVERTVKLKKMLSKNLTVTEDEMETYFKENKETFDQAEQVHASHILLKDEKAASGLLEQLKDGGDFAELAKEHSEDPGSAPNGGDLGFFPKGQMAPEFEKAAFEAKPDELVGPVKTTHGYHIIKVIEKKEAKKAAFGDNKETIRETLLNQKLQTEYQSWLESVKSESKIDHSFEKK
jgi:foldase protein PrsA